MRTTLLLGAMVGLLLVNAPQTANQRYVWMGDGHSLWSWCDKTIQSQQLISNDDRFRGHFCLGYIYGIIDMAKRPGQPRSFCIPPNMAMDETIREMVLDLKAHPKELYERAEVLATDSLERTFPCK